VSRVGQKAREERRGLGLYFRGGGGWHDVDFDEKIGAEVIGTDCVNLGGR
jgi:hypothetical protein